VGREDELRYLEAFSGDRPPSSVVFIHGPGGIGKSALLRELVRRAERRGFTVHWIEGRELPPVSDAIEELTRRALVRSYLDPAPSHEMAGRSSP
jgi:AAA+ ATPase superfamily predicted ATPase